MASEQSARGAAASSQTGAESEAARQHVPRQRPRHGARAAAEREPSGAALGFTLTAAILMMISGGWNILEGLAAIIHGSFVVDVRNYAYSLSATSWGWFHLILGAVMLAAGIGLFVDKLWARIVGVCVVAVSMIVNFLYIPYLPAWSIVVIAIDMAILWALLGPRDRWAY
jgi:hypothetical protein